MSMARSMVRRLSTTRIGAAALALAVLGGAYAFLGGDDEVARFAQATGPVVDLDWDMLVPDGAVGATSAGVVEHETLSDDASPWQADTDTSAVRTDLDGQRVRIPGYMTPLTFEDAEVGQFLLVPYVGACVHVPPPPANQIVYVEVDGTVPVLEMWEPFLAVGTLRTAAQSTELAEVGYTMNLEHMEIYEEPELDIYDDTLGGDTGLEMGDAGMGTTEMGTTGPVDDALPEAGTGGTELGQVFEDAFGAPGPVLAE